jgi:hypothetical protein
MQHLCIVVPETPEAPWFEEAEHEGIAVETYPVRMADLDDVATVLASPALPFNLCEGVILADTHGRLRALQMQLAPLLCAPEYVHQRVTAAWDNARRAYQQAREALAHGNLVESQLGLSVGLWNTTCLASALLCRCPTNRRGFVHVH